MKLISPSYEIIKQEPGIEGIYKQIELAARNCYKSEPVEGITSKDFVDRMIKSGHLSTLEHGTVYLAIPHNPFSSIADSSFRYRYNPYSKVNNALPTLPDLVYVTTNYRVLVENDWLDDLQYLCEPTEFHEKRVTVKFTSNIHFYKDITRHRKMSYAIESTRYCNYSKDKFDKELTFIVPVWSNLREGTISYFRDMKPMWDSLQYTNDGTIIKDNYSKAEMDFVYAMQVANNMYINLTVHGWQAQQAAEVLPQATKADIIVTGFVSDWQHIFNLRTSIIAATGKPHPEVSRLIDPLYEEFKTKGLI